MFLTIFFYLFSNWKHCQKYHQTWTNWLIWIIKADVVSNFCLIRKNPNNFLVPKMIESACKTFMPIQTLDLHRVGYYTPRKLHFCSVLKHPLKGSLAFLRYAIKSSKRLFKRTSCKSLENFFIWLKATAGQLIYSLVSQDLLGLV